MYIINNKRYYGNYNSKYRNGQVDVSEHIIVPISEIGLMQTGTAERICKVVL